MVHYNLNMTELFDSVTPHNVSKSGTNFDPDQVTWGNAQAIAETGILEHLTRDDMLRHNQVGERLANPDSTSNYDLRAMIIQEILEAVVSIQDGNPDLNTLVDDFAFLPPRRESDKTSIINHIWVQYDDVYAEISI